jgi:hypothetical protein
MMMKSQGQAIAQRHPTSITCCFSCCCLTTSFDAASSTFCTSAAYADFQVSMSFCMTGTGLSRLQRNQCHSSHNHVIPK